MLVIPAIDFSGGRLARLADGRAVPVEAFDGDPIAAARAFVAQGAEWVHVVDMDHALHGSSGGSALFARIRGTGARVQASGGIATPEAIAKAFEAGADRVVVGSGALVDLEGVAVMAERWGDRLAFGLEVQDGRLIPRGRASFGETPSVARSLEVLSACGVFRLVFTAVGLVGSLGGPDLETLRTVMGAGYSVIVAGGVATQDHIATMAAMDPPPEGVIVGRGLYEGALTLPEAMKAAGSAP